MKALLDTHFLLWLVTESPRLGEFPGLARFAPWGVSPISLLELQYLAEIGRIELDNPAFTAALSADPRFEIDEVPLVRLISAALDLSWTRDPFDRLLTAHSRARRVPLCTLDRKIRDHYPLVVNPAR